MNGWLVLALAAVAVAVLVTADCRVARARCRTRLRMLAVRPETTTEQWYQNGFVETGIPAEVVLAVCEPLAERLRLHVSQLRSADSFSEELKPVTSLIGLLDDDPIELFVYIDLCHLLDEESERMITNDEWFLAETLEEMVKWCAPRLKPEDVV